MSFRNLMVIGAVVALGFGIALVLAPERLMSLYGLTLDPAGAFMGRMLGVEFIGVGLLAWLVRNTANPEARHPVLLVFLVADTLGFVVTLFGQLSGLMNLLGWSIVAIFLLMSLAWAYFLLERRRTSKETVAK